MGKLHGLLFGLATLLLVTLATFFFVARDWLPPLKSNRIAIDHALWATLLVTGVAFIVTNLLLAWFAYRYTDKPGAEAAYWHDNPRLEWSWTLVTAVIMFAFLFNALGLWAQITAAPPKDAMVIEVTGQQFAWNVRYPGRDGIFGRTDPKLVDPSEANFIGIDKRRSRGRRRHHAPAEPALPAGGTGRASGGSLPRRDPQLLPSQLPGEAGRDARDDRGDLVHSDRGSGTSRSRAPSTAASGTTGCAGRCTSFPSRISTRRSKRPPTRYRRPDLIWPTLPKPTLPTSPRAPGVHLALRLQQGSQGHRDPVLRHRHVDGPRRGPAGDADPAPARLAGEDMARPGPDPAARASPRA